MTGIYLLHDILEKIVGKRFADIVAWIIVIIALIAMIGLFIQLWVD